MADATAGAMGQVPFQKAVADYRAGRLDSAAQLCRDTVRSDPSHADALHLLGLIVEQKGRRKEGIDFIRRALAIRPRDVRYLHSLGKALIAGKSFPEAAEVLRECCRLNPTDVEALNNLGNVLLNLDRLKEAAAVFRQALGVRPDNIEVLNNLGLLCKTLGRLDESQALLERAIKLRPEIPQLHCNMGAVWEGRGLFDPAIECFRKAVELNPNYAEAHNSLGNALRQRVKTGDAIAAYLRAIAVKPDYAEAYNNLGNTYKELGESDKALKTYAKALALKPDHAEGFCNYLFSLLYLDDRAESDITAEYRKFGKTFASPLRPARRVEPVDRDPDRPLRIGYVSADFRLHAVGFFMEPLLANHDRLQCEIFCYANDLRSDRMSLKLRGHVPDMRNIAGLNDEDAADLVRKDRIDILVDLSGLSGGNRLMIFARQPAPLQATYLGFPATTGLEEIDCRITDAESDPAGLTEAHFVEKLVRTEKCLWCFRPWDRFPETLPESQHLAGTVTFGSFNNFSKISDLALTTWAEILARAPRTRLIIKVWDIEGSRERILKAFRKQGVDPSRIEIIGFLELPAFYELHRRIDLHLDPFPYNGTKTTCDALWLGVPVLTWAGDRHRSRVGSSLMKTIGLPELVASTRQGYIARAIQLAREEEKLREWRLTMRDRMLASPLMDAPGQTRRLEAIFRAMWRERLASPD